MQKPGGELAPLAVDSDGKQKRSAIASESHPGNVHRRAPGEEVLGAELTCLAERTGPKAAAGGKLRSVSSGLGGVEIGRMRAAPCLP